MDASMGTLNHKNTFIFFQKQSVLMHISLGLYFIIIDKLAILTDWLTHWVAYKNSSRRAEDLKICIYKGLGMWQTEQIEKPKNLSI